MKRPSTLLLLAFMLVMLFVASTVTLTLNSSEMDSHAQSTPVASAQLAEDGFH